MKYALHLIFMALWALSSFSFESDKSDRDVYVLQLEFKSKSDPDFEMDKFLESINSNDAIEVRFRHKGKIGSLPRFQLILKGPKSDIVSAIKKMTTYESYRLIKLSDFVYQVSLGPNLVMEVELPNLADALARSGYHFEKLATSILGDDCIDFKRPRACFKRWAAPFWDQRPMAISNSLNELEKVASGQIPLDEWSYWLKGDLVYLKEGITKRVHLHLDGDQTIGYLYSFSDGYEVVKRGFTAIYEELKGEREKREFPLLVYSTADDASKRDRATGIISQYLLNEDKNTLAHWKITKKRGKGKERFRTYFLVEVDKFTRIPNNRKVMNFNNTYWNDGVHIYQVPLFMHVAVLEIEIATNEKETASIWIPTFLEKGGFSSIKDSDFKYTKLFERLMSNFTDRQSYFKSLFEKIDDKKSFSYGKFKTLFSSGKLKSLGINLKVFGSMLGRFSWGNEDFMEYFYLNIFLQDELGKWREQYNLFEVSGLDEVNRFLEKMSVGNLK